MRYAFVLILLLVASYGTAQRLSVSSYRKVAGDSVKSATEKKAKKVNHYLGVQANQLLNQIFNFSGTATAVSNPYLIVYAMNSMTTGWGLNAGLGYNVNSTSDNSDPNTTRKTSLNDFSLRLGIEKKTFLSKRWLASYGFDLLYSSQGDDTNATSQFQFNTTITDTNSTTLTFGFGPRLSLNYLISDKIIVGTEATYYLKSNKLSQKISNTNINFSMDPLSGKTTQEESFSSSTTSQKSSDFTFSVPVAVFLIVKLRN